MNVAVPSFNVLSLFSGIGGLDLAIRIAIPEARTILFVEIEIAAAAILASHMENGALDAAPIWSDITTLDARPMRGLVDAVVGGFPCQDLSVAGKREGIGGQRSGLVHDMFRIIEECRPKIAFLENVSGLLSSRTLLHRSEITEYFDRVRGAATCAKERWHAENHIERLHRRLLPTHGISALLYVQCRLEELGYRVESGLFTAAECGASQKRERIFILANRERPERWPEIGPAVCRDEGADAKWQSTSRTGECSGVLGDPERSRRETTGSGWQFDTGREPEPGCLAMADTGSPGHQGNELGNASGNRGGQETSGPTPELRYAHLPAFPPVPGDHEAWQAILERWPELAPAVADTIGINDDARGPSASDVCVQRSEQAEVCGGEVGDPPDGNGQRETSRSGRHITFSGQAGQSEQETESEVCNMADGIPSELSRTDKLRALGNAVVPLQAALAVRALMRKAGLND